MLQKICDTENARYQSIKKLISKKTSAANKSLIYKYEYHLCCNQIGWLHLKMLHYRFLKITPYQQPIRTTVPHPQFCLSVTSLHSQLHLLIIHMHNMTKEWTKLCQICKFNCAISHQHRHWISTLYSKYMYVPKDYRWLVCKVKCK